MGQINTMAKTTLEYIAPSSEEAITKGLAELGISREKVEIEILDSGSKGLFGIGGRQARVRLTVVGAADEPAKVIEPVEKPEAPVVKPMVSVPYAAAEPSEKEDYSLPGRRPGTSRGAMETCLCGSATPCCAPRIGSGLRRGLVTTAELGASQGACQRPGSITVAGTPRHSVTLSRFHAFTLPRFHVVTFSHCQIAAPVALSPHPAPLAGRWAFRYVVPRRTAGASSRAHVCGTDEADGLQLRR